MTDEWRPSCGIAALEARAALLDEIRRFFRDREVLEVQTALLGTYTVTDVNIDSLAVGGHGYLQTSPEYQLKRLLANGAPSLYHLSQVFRAGERGRLHNPEFTLLEWYRLGFDDSALMDEVAELVDLALGPAPYERLAYQDLVGDLDRPSEALDLALCEALDALPSGRYFVTRYPAAQAALSRLCPNDPSVAARFELVVDGVELANGYHELTDAEEQRRRFAADVEARNRLGKVEPTVDEKFLAALEHGLPDCAGVALGVDRLLMLRMGANSLAEVLAFPAGVA
jgi:lysyl-tRNA synthetase class 2